MQGFSETPIPFVVLGFKVLGFVVQILECEL